MTALLIPVAPGELIDKITILQIKSARITAADKLAHVQRELKELQATHSRMIEPSEQLMRWTAELRSVNETLWDIEDSLRACEREQDFGDRFIALARQVYQCNDRRAELKRQINLFLNSTLVEEKSYAPY
jgi:hypothetical protein